MESLLLNYYEQFKALYDSTRVDILDGLAIEELSAENIANKLSLSHSKVSYHLLILINGKYDIRKKI